MPSEPLVASVDHSSAPLPGLDGYKSFPSSTLKDWIQRTFFTANTEPRYDQIRGPPPTSDRGATRKNQSQYFRASGVSSSSLPPAASATTTNKGWTNQASSTRRGIRFRRSPSSPRAWGARFIRKSCWLVHSVHSQTAPKLHYNARSASYSYKINPSSEIAKRPCRLSVVALGIAVPTLGAAGRPAAVRCIARAGET
jgi:hypothetical protein